jgi:hypothetical protein
MRKSSEAESKTKKISKWLGQVNAQSVFYSTKLSLTMTSTLWTSADDHKKREIEVKGLPGFKSM